MNNLMSRQHIACEKSVVRTTFTVKTPVHIIPKPYNYMTDNTSVILLSKFTHTEVKL